MSGAVGSREQTAAGEGVALRTARGRRTLRWFIAAALAGALALAALLVSGPLREYQLARTGLSQLRKEAEARPEDPLVAYYFGLRAYEAGLAEEAQEPLERAVAQAPEMARAHVALARVLDARGNPVRALEEADRARSADPKNWESGHCWAQLRLRDSPAEAAAALQRLAVAHPRQPEIWETLGECRMRLGEKGEAVDAFRKASALRPANARYLQEWGGALLETNQFPEALSALERAHAAAPQDQQTLAQLGAARLALASGPEDLIQAEALLRQAEAALPRNQDNAKRRAQLLGQLAEIARRRRTPEEALRLLSAARKEDPNNIGYLYQQAEVYRIGGNETRARELMRAYYTLSRPLNRVYQLDQRVAQAPRDPALRLDLAEAYAEMGDVVRARQQFESYRSIGVPLEGAEKRVIELLRHPKPAPIIPAP